MAPGKAQVGADLGLPHPGNPRASTLSGQLHTMWEQGGGAPVWSVAVHWVHRLWGFPGGAGQGQPPPLFGLWATLHEL